MTLSVVGDALWNPQAHMPTARAKRLTIVSGDGAWVTSSTGQRLLDATAGLWFANIGHGREEVARAAYEQMRTLETYHTFGRFANEPALRLADRLAALGPVPDAKVLLTSGGSDSVDLACKLARRHWQLAGHRDRRIVLSRDRAYHGLHAFGTSITGLPYNREGLGSESLVPETARVATNDIDKVRQQVSEIGVEHIAAIIVEPVIGTGGVVAPKEGYLQGLQALCDDSGILFIVDEVITGFGRTGHMFGSNRYGLRPDMVTLAKGVTSGYAPLGAVLVAPRVADRFFVPPPGGEAADVPMFRHGLTYAGHATSCAVAHTVLDILEREQLIDRARRLERVLEEALESLKGHQHVVDIRAGAAFMAGVQLDAGVSGEEVAEASADRGVIVRTIHDNTLQICPPFVTTDDEVRVIVDTLKCVLDETVAR